MARLKYGLSGLSPSELLLKGVHVLSKMSPNPNFPTPDPTVATVQAAADDLSNAIQEAMDGGTDRIAMRDAKAATLNGLLHGLGDYVQAISKGNASIILSSGFEVVQRGGSVGQPDKPGDAAAETGSIMGTIDFSWAAVHGVTDYIIEMNSTDPNDQAQWKLIGFSTKSRFTATGLNSLSVYWFRVCALGTAGKGPYSDPARGVTQ